MKQVNYSYLTVAATYYLNVNCIKFTHIQSYQKKAHVCHWRSNENNNTCCEMDPPWTTRYT